MRAMRPGAKYGNRSIATIKEVPSATPSLWNATGPGGLFSNPALEKTTSPKVKKVPRSIITKKSGAEGHTSAMIALYVPARIAAELERTGMQLFGPSAEKADDLHITLAYLGKLEDIKEKIPALVSGVQNYCTNYLANIGHCLRTVVSGLDFFDTVQEDGTVPIYYKTEAAFDFYFFVAGLENTLNAVGTPARRDFGDTINPHITMAYRPKDQVPLAVSNTLQVATAIDFVTVTLCLGDLQITFPIAPPVEPLIMLKGPEDQVEFKSTLISPGVYRIAGNLCQVHGHFGPCDAADTGSASGFKKGAKKPKGGKGKRGGGKAAKPKKPVLSPEEKKAQRDAAKAQQTTTNRTNALAGMKERPNDDAMAALDTLRQGGEANPAILASMEQTGLVEKHTDGSYSLTTQGNSYQKALDHGDIAGAQAAMARAKDRVAGSQDRAAVADQRKKVADQRKAEVQARRDARTASRNGKKPNAGKPQNSGSGSSSAQSPSSSLGAHSSSSGGGGGSSGGGAGHSAPYQPQNGNGSSSGAGTAQSPEDKKAAKLAEQTTQEALNTTKIGEQLGLDDDLANLNQFLEGDDLDVPSLQKLYDMGLVDIDGAGEARSNSFGKALADAARKGDLRAAKDGQSHAKDMVAQETAKSQANQGGVVGKSMEDAPNYGPAASSGTSCATCEHYKDTWCELYSFIASPAATCDNWHSKLLTIALSSSNVPRPSLVPFEAVPSFKALESGEGGFTIFKDKNDEWRWILYSSDAFEDRDKEIVTRKALEADVARTDGDGDYGPLRWWHVGTPIFLNPLDWRSVRAGPGLDIGKCDFSAMEGPVLIESGTFNSPEIGEAISRKAKGLQSSLGFSHPLSDPDKNGHYNEIRRFERSLTPINKASNPRTHMIVAKKEKIMDNNKINKFKELVGDELAEGAIHHAQSTTKEVRAAGIREKSMAPTLEELQLQIADLSSQVTAFKARNVRPPDNDVKELQDENDNTDEDGTPTKPVKAGFTKKKDSDNSEPPVISTKSPGDDAVAKNEDGGGDGGEEDDMEPQYIGDMTGTEFVDLLHTSLSPLFEGVNKSFDLHTKVGDLHKSMGEMKQYLGGMKTKDDSDASIAELQNQIVTLKESLQEAISYVNDMQGSVPRALQNRPAGQAYKSSEAVDNVIQPNSAMYQEPTIAGMQGQPGEHVLSWVDNFVTPKQQQGGALQAPVVAGT